MTPSLLRLLLVTLAATQVGCVVVPQNRRRHLADPTMKMQDNALEDRARSKLYNSREASAGGNGRSAGGGCACGN